MITTASNEVYYVAVFLQLNMVGKLVAGKLYLMNDIIDQSLVDRLCALYSYKIAD